jgi:uncharacterized protein (DUF885 family)
MHPFDKFPEAVPEADRKRLRAEGLAAVKDSVIPTYVKFTAFVRDEYAPKGRAEPGAWSLPDGDAWYAFRVKESTTTNLTPEEIHELGLAQVKEIETRMLGVVNQLGYKDMKSFKAAVDADPKLHAQSREQILDLYRKYEDQMYAKLPEMFGRLPKSKLEVMPVEEFREKEASDASYVDGTPDGSRPGHIMVNTGDYSKRTLLDLETTAYHEGVPGTSHADLNRSGTARVADFPAARILYGVHRRMGALLRATGQRSRVLSGPVQLLRPLAGRHAASDPPGRRYRLPLQALDAAAGGRLFP